MLNFPSLVAKRRAAESAQSAVNKLNSEEKVLQHLLDTKPSILCIGKELYTNASGIEENLSAYIERFIRKGLIDRSERLDYLQKLLRSKCGDQTQKFYALMGFLLAMEDDSTDVESKVDLGAKEYSNIPDEEEDKDYEAKLKAENELKKIIVDEICADRHDIVYSSESELSNWDSEEESSEDVVPEIKVADVSTVSVRDTVRSREALAVTLESEAEWTQRVERANDFLKEKFPQHINTLSQQPVISSHVDLHLKFGLFWEWKKNSGKGTGSNLEIIPEARIMQEIIWQFATPFTENSVVFANAESEDPKFVLPTLSCAALSPLLRKYLKVPQAVKNLKSFVRTVQESSHGTEMDMYPKVIHAFASAIAESLRYIAVCVGEIKTSLPSQAGFERKCKNVMTLLGMERELRKALPLLLTLEHLFVQCLGDFSTALNFKPEEAWLVSERLMAALEVALRFEKRLENWIFTLFIFSQCLAAYLDDFMSTLVRSEWPSVSIFVRDQQARLSDANFWKSSVTVRPYEENLDIPPLSCLEKIVPRMLMFLKTIEMLRQLNEDSSRVVGELPSAQLITESFLKNFVPCAFDVHSNEEGGHSLGNSVPDYQRYFSFMTLNDRRVLSSFQHILKEQQQRIPPSNDLVGEPLCKFLRIDAVSLLDSAVVLPGVVNSFFDPILVKGESSLRDILKQYKVQESMSLFQEIILGGREDFAQAVIELAKKSASNRFTYEDPGSKDRAFQKLLTEFYPEGRENFEIEMRLDTTSDLRFWFDVKTKFPLNLVLTPDALKKYLFISQQLYRMRKSVWTLNSLKMKECCPGRGVDLKRALLLRFSLLHYCSSIRSFFMFKVFSTNSGSSLAIDEEGAFEEILNVHDEYLTRIESRLLKVKLMDGLILKKIVAMSDALQKCWAKEIPLPILIRMEEWLKNCWGVIRDFCKVIGTQEFAELEYFTGPVPSYL